MVAEAAGDMSVEVTTLVVLALAGCLVGGTIGVVGVLLGLLTSPRRRERWRVRCVATAWQLEFQKTGARREAGSSVELDLLSGGQRATPLRGLSVALCGED